MARVLIAAQSWGVVANNQGTGASSQSATLVSTSSGSAATIYQEATGSGQVADFKTDADGVLPGWVDSDTYTLSVAGESFQVEAVSATTLPTGVVTSTNILNGTIVNADVNASAAIVGSKLDLTSGTGNITATPTSAVKLLSSSAVTTIVASAPVKAAGTTGFEEDQYGNVFFGPNEGVPRTSAINTSDYLNHYLLGSMYSAANERFHARHYFATEASNPANVHLARMNTLPVDSWPYGTAGTGVTDYKNNLAGCTANQTIGKVWFSASATPYGGTPGVTPVGDHGGLGNCHAAQMAAETAEDPIQLTSLGSSDFAAGGDLHFDTTAIGETSITERLRLTATGVLGNLTSTFDKTDVRRAYLVRGDIIAGNKLYAVSDIIARQDEANGASATMVAIGAKGPASEAGVLFGSVGDTNLYRSAANNLKTDDALTISLALDHDGTTAGFYGVTPTTRPAAYTQTYSTTTRTHSNDTASDMATTASTQTTPWGFASQAQADAIATKFNALRVDVDNAKQVLNQVIDDLQLNGLLA